MLWQDKYLARVKVYLCWVPIREKHERDVSPWPTEGCLTPQPYLPIFLSFNNFVFSKSLRAKGAAHSSKMKFFFVAVVAVAVILSSAYALTLPSFGHLLQVFGLAPDNSPSFVQRKTHSLNRRHVAVPTKLGNVTQSQYIAAKSLVDDALRQVEEINSVRFASPSRNHYSPRPAGRRGGTRKGQPAPFKMTPELKAAAALTNKIDNLNSPAPAQSVANRTLGPLDARAAAAGTFWMQNIARNGAWPWGKNPNHKVGTYAPILSPSFAILGSGAGVGTCCFCLKADVCAHRCFAMLKTTAQRETE